MTPSPTPQRLAREATAAELAEKVKQCAELYSAAFAGHQSTGLVGHQTLVDRGAALYAAIDRLASLALPQLEEQQRWMQPGQPEQTR